MSRFLRSTPLLLRPSLRGAALPRPSTLALLHEHRRNAASTVSGRPASQTFKHAAVNIREEAGNSAGDLAKLIASNGAMSKDTSFIAVTKANLLEVPKEYIVLGLAGGLPYLGTAAVTTYSAYQAGLAAAGELSIDPGLAITALDQALNIQVSYGAVLMSFLGALHWGMEFAGYGGHKGYARLALGAAPVLFVWPTLALQPTAALAIQWAGFTALWWADARATQAGWAPRWYSQYRFYLSILIGTCIIGTLAVTSFYGPVGGHGFVSRDLTELREERRKNMAERTGRIGGPIETESTGENGEYYIAVHKKKSEKEEGEEKQQE